MEVLCIGADFLFLEFLQPYAKKLRVSIRNLRIYANRGCLEFMPLCADSLFLEFLQTYAKELRVCNKDLCMNANGKFLKFLRIYVGPSIIS